MQAKHRMSYMLAVVMGFSALSGVTAAADPPEVKAKDAPVAVEPATAGPATAQPATAAMAEAKEVVREPAKTPAVLAMAPMDALVIAYLANPEDIIANPVWTISEVDQEPLAAKLLDASGATFTGPMMFAVSGTPMNPGEIRMEFAITPADGPEAFFKNLREAWLPAMSAATMMPATAGPHGNMWKIELPGCGMPPLYAGGKDGMVYGCSRYNDVAQWMNGEALAHRFVEGDDIQRLAAEAVASPDAFAYVNLRPLMPLAWMELEREAPGLYQTLGLENVQFATWAASWSKGAPSAQVTVGLADENAGVFDLLAPRNGPVQAPTLVPEGYPFVLQGAMVTAANDVERLNEFLRTIDADIANEFDQERREFAADFGFDPVADFLGNMVDQWTLAAKIDQGGNFSGVATVKLADTEVFAQQVDALMRAFDLEFDATTCEGTVIYSAAHAPGTAVSWATVDDNLIVSDRIEPVCDVVQRYGANVEGVPATGAETKTSFASVAAELPAEASRVFMVDLTPLAALGIDAAKEDPEAAPFVETLERLASTPAGVGVALARGDGVLTISFVGNRAIDAKTREIGTMSVAASLERSREMAQRVVSATNVRSIIQACVVYANDHKNVWPDDFATLLQEGMVATQMFLSPLDKGPGVELSAANVDEYSGYLYRNGTGLGPNEVVVCERRLGKEGANFGFADGHVEWVSGERAEELHRFMRSAAQ